MPALKVEEGAESQGTQAVSRLSPEKAEKEITLPAP